jgi:hypothetical protein
MKKKQKSRKKTDRRPVLERRNVEKWVKNYLYPTSVPKSWEKECGV